MRIHIVQGTAGEYSGRRDWLVMAHTGPPKAHTHARQAMRRAKRMEKGRPSKYDAFKGVNEFDPAAGELKK